MTDDREQTYRDTLARASARIKELMARVQELQGSGSIAVVGIGCRFPGGADSPERFWELLERGGDAVGTVPSDRWNSDDWYDPDPSKPGTCSTRRGAFLADVRSFDARQFGIPPLEADYLDPQQRLLLTVVRETLERSGIAPATLQGSRTGVFIGMCGIDYAQAHLTSGDPTRISPFSLTGVLPSVAAGRISYHLDLTGPSIALDTACSSSLVALLVAVRALLARECDGALAGGVNLMLTPGTTVALSRMNALSPDGFCRAFGDLANGYVRGEGCGVLYLKRLEDAEREGLPILGLIRGGAVNHDGRSNGLTAPNALSQQEVIRQALAAAGLTADQVDCIETHGTGTPLGDPIEARALAAVFAGHRELPIGSVKSNIGHLEAAAGIASVIKALLMAHRGIIPASLHAEPPNRHIPWNDIPLRVATAAGPFPETGRPRTVGVSSFGFSGTNAHLIVQEYRRPDGGRFPLSLREPAALQPEDHWLDPMQLYRHRQAPVAEAAHPAADPIDLLAAVLGMVSAVSGRSAAELDPDAGLFELGLDSLMLIQVRDMVNREYGVTLELSHLMEEVTTLRRLAAFVAEHGRGLAPVPAAAAPVPALPAAGGNSGIEQFFDDQLAEIRGLLQRQLETLQQGGGPLPAERRRINFRATILEDESVRLTGQQQRFVGSVIERHTARTGGSKALAQRHRRHLSDWINTLAYRGCLKELVYPIASRSSSGPRFTDIDGNEYLDLAMGFGVAFFGHTPSFIAEAVRQRLGRGMELATQLPEAGEAAEIFCRLTGMERVTFCNTGSEAVMMALRIARTVTGRERVVLFAGSYHGTTDGVLAFADETGRVMPTTPGVPFGAIGTVTVLPYGTDDSLEKIRALAPQLAAILVEPVQSRRPGFQPVAFLKELRNIADQSGAALIFDEMITGFRTHPGGAQAIFGIRADLATYGKAVGGGMPVSMIAGSARFMDAVDGGFWQYGDESRPDAEVMFFGGTFCRHPLALAASLAALRHMEQEGPGLQATVNARAERLARELNDFFRRERVPMLVQQFGSLFRFESYGQYALLLQPLELDLFFYLLMIRGIYTWERRICFLSTAHSDEDINLIVTAVQESIAELRAGGFPFEGTPPDSPPSGPLPPGGGERAVPEGEEERNGESVLPMSSAQKRLYILSQYEEGEGPYHLGGATLIEGELDLQRLRQVFGELVQRHEALRTGFELRDGEPVQVIYPRSPLTVELHEVAEDAALEEASRFIAPFDLAAPPLLRVLVLRTAPQRHLLVVDSHHIALDGFSMSILVGEFVALYGGRNLPLPSMQFRDRTAEELRYLGSERRRADERFWLEYLDGDLPVLDLPLDFPRPVRQSFKGGLIRFDLDAGFTARLKQTAAACGSTLPMLLLSTWALLLHRLSGQDDLIVQMPAAGREGEESFGAVGMFAATLPLRFRIDRTQPFAAFLRETTRRQFACFEHQQYPFDLLLELLQVAPDPSRNPLFDVSFVFEKGDGRVLELPGLTFTPRELPRSTAMFDLTLEAIEEQGLLRMSLEYATALFAPETARRWSGYYRLLLEHVCADPGTPVSHLDLLPPGEREVLERGGLTPRLRPLGKITVPELIAAAALAHPGEPALLWPSSGDPDGATDRLTFAELARRIEGTARVLAECHGVGPGSLVGLYAGRSAELLVAMYAVLRAGGAYVPVDVAYPAERINHIIADSGMGLLIADRPTPSPVTSVRLQELCAAGTTAPAGTELPWPTADSRAYVIYTSGSTGLPKGCGMTHANLAHYVSWAAGEYLSGRNCGCFPFATPLSFDLTITAVYTPLLVGKPVYVYPEELGMDDLLRHALRPDTPVDCLKITPSHVSLMEHLGVTASNVALAVVGGEQFTREQIRLLERLNPAMRIVNEYGPTETAVGCMIAEVHSSDDRVTIGVPITDMAMFVLDEAGEPLPFGVKGELCIAGPGLGQGYLNRPELTAAKFPPHPFRPGERLYRTGDIGLLRSDGRFECLGRADDQVKLNGYRVELGEIEQAVLELPGVSEAVVVVRESEQGREAVAFVTGEPSACAGIRDALSRRLPGYMIPSRVHRLERLPVTPNGKADRKLLARLEPAEQEPGTPGRDGEPRGEDEQRIAALWCRVLGLERVGRDDQFFSIGGQSIKAMQVVALIQKELGISLKLKEFFAAPTVAGLADLLRRGTQAAPESIPRLPAAPDYPLSHGQKRFWLLDQTDREAATAYTMTGAWLVTGNLDRERLRQVFAAVAARHESLRTSFAVSGGEPRQRVAPTVVIPWREEDLRGLPDAEERGMELVRQEGLTPFDLAQAPLCRVLTVALPPSADGRERSLLVVSLHHIIADGWSNGLLMTEVSALYNGTAPESLSSLPVQYRDYAAWHNRLIAGPRGVEMARHWLRHLAGDLPPLELPTDFPRPERASGRGGSVRVTLGRELAGRVRALAAGRGITLFTLLLAGVKALLHARSGATDLVVGAPVSGREHPDLADQIGLYLNTLALRDTVQPETPFSRFLEQVRETVEAGFANQEYPFDLVVEALGGASRFRGHTPLFDVLLVLQNTAPAAVELEGADAAPFFDGALMSKFDLMFDLVDDAELSGTIEYSADLFRPETARRYGTELARLLTAVADDPGITLAELARLLATPEEQEAVQQVLARAAADLSEEF